MDFSATRISTQDFTPEQIRTILADARQQLADERFPTSKREYRTTTMSVDFDRSIPSRITWVFPLCE